VRDLSWRKWDTERGKRGKMGQQDERRSVIRDRRCVREDDDGKVGSACGVRWDVLRVPRCLAAAFGGGGGMGGSGVGTTHNPSFVSHSPPSFASTNLAKAEWVFLGSRTVVNSFLKPTVWIDRNNSTRARPL
jgi:hypothetical protein